jgi:hypothetical protein
MAIEWSTDIDTTLSRARESHKPVFLDFSAAPA